MQHPLVANDAEWLHGGLDVAVCAYEAAHRGAGVAVVGTGAVEHQSVGLTETAGVDLLEAARLALTETRLGDAAEIAVDGVERLAASHQMARIEHRIVGLFYFADISRHLGVERCLLHRGSGAERLVARHIERREVKFLSDGKPVVGA